jgi:proteic killer suppression protein
MGEDYREGRNFAHLYTLSVDKYTEHVYTNCVIRSFADDDTRRIWEGEVVRSKPQDIQRRAFRKLQALNAATEVEDLRYPAGNRLEALRGDRRGQWSIRINDQWRICFRWEPGANGPEDVEIADYH